MTTTSLVDLSPALRVMLVGALLASVAIAWLALRRRASPGSGWLRALTVLTLFLTFDLVVFGAFTRLTDSGLGCPDWPGCYGSASPVGAGAAISAAQSAMPTGPVTHPKAWIEMVHRYLATGVGTLIVLLAISSWRTFVKAKGGRRVADIAWPSLTLFWVCVQGAFGALTVTMKLFPAIVTMHLLGGLLLLALLAVQAEHQGRRATGRAQQLVDPATRAALLTAFVLVFVQVALGGWVSTNYAVLACTDFPTCHGTWWPAMDFAQGFAPWRALGLTAGGQHITFEALTAIHFAHRLMAAPVLIALGVLAWRLAHFPKMRHLSRWIAAVAALQFLTGLANVVLDWPLAAALLHTAGAAALVLLLTWTASASTSLAQPTRVKVARARTRGVSA